MFGGAAGYAVMSLPTQHFPQQQEKHTSEKKATVFGKQQLPHYNQQEQQVPLVDVSLDLMQYMSESFAADESWVVPTAPAGCQQPHAGATKAGSLAACSSLMHSSCSTHSNQMVPDSPTCSSNSSQQQQDCDMRGCSCGSDAAAAAAPTSSSGSGSSTGSQSHPTAAGSCLSYNDDFVFQCYYGNPNSPTNQQQQRPKQHSPFAAYACFPGFSL